MGGSNISTIHSASVGWNSQTSTREREKAEIASSPLCSHPDSSTLLCSVQTPDTLSPHLPTCPDCSERISMTLQHHSESSSWFMMILTAGETVSAVCMIQQRQSERETEAERSLLVEFGEFSFRMVWSLSLMSVTEQIGAFVCFLLVWEREGEVFKPQSRAPGCPCCQDWASVLDRDYSEPLAFAEKNLVWHARTPVVAALRDLIWAAVLLFSRRSFGWNQNQVAVLFLGYSPFTIMFAYFTSTQFIESPVFAAVNSYFQATLLFSARIGLVGTVISLLLPCKHCTLRCQSFFLVFIWPNGSWNSIWPYG